MRVYATVNVAKTSTDHPLGEAVDVFLNRRDAEWCLEEVRADEPELAAELGIVEGEFNVRPGMN